MIDFHLLSRTYVLLHNTANCALCPNRRGSMHVLERSDQQNLQPSTGVRDLIIRCDYVE